VPLLRFDNLLGGLWDDLRQPDVLLQAGAVFVCILLAWLLSRLVRVRTTEG